MYQHKLSYMYVTLLCTQCFYTSTIPVAGSILCIHEALVAMGYKQRHSQIVCHRDRLFITERVIFKDGLNKGTECC